MTLWITCWQRLSRGQVYYMLLIDFRHIRNVWHWPTIFFKCFPSFSLPSVGVEWKKCTHVGSLPLCLWKVKVCGIMYIHYHAQLNSGTTPTDISGLPGGDQWKEKYFDEDHIMTDYSSRIPTLKTFPLRFLVHDKYSERNKLQ